MSRGRSRDKTYTKDVRSAGLSALQRMTDHPEETSVQDRRSGPSAEEMRRSISNGECPFCGRHYQNIAIHTNRTHGVDRFELKEMMGVPKSYSVCTPEFKERCAEKQRRAFRDDPKKAAKFIASQADQKTKKRVYSAAGRAVQMEKLKASYRGHPHGHAGQVEDMQQHNRDLYHRRNDERDEAIIAMVQGGATYSDLKDTIGVSVTIVKQVLARYGVEANMRSAMMKRPARKKVALDAMAAGHRARCAEVSEARLNRWAELGKTWEAVDILVAEFGSSPKSMRGFLRSRGEHIPDGRTVSPLRNQSKRKKTHP